MSRVLDTQRARISADRYQKMVATGVLTKYDRVELIDGEMIDMAPIGTLHSAVTARLTKLFVLSAGDSAIVSPGGSIRLGDHSVPQPDLMLLKPREDFYSGQIPTASDVLLVMEVSDSSLAFDQSTKRALYGRLGVAEYWVIDLPGQRVHVYGEPSAQGYAQVMEYASTDVVSPRALPAVQVMVSRLFG